MPCLDIPSAQEIEDNQNKSAQQQLTQIKNKLDDVTAMLCHLLRAIENGKNIQEYLKSNGKLSKWWKNHKKNDAKRHAKARQNLPQAVQILRDLPEEDLKKVLSDLQKTTEE